MPQASRSHTPVPLHPGVLLRGLIRDRPPSRDAGPPGGRRRPPSRRGGRAGRHPRLEAQPCRGGSDPAGAGKLVTRTQGWAPRRLLDLLSVAPNRRKINFAFLQAKLRCIGPGSTIGTSNEWYGFVSDAYTKLPGVPVRNGRFSLSDKVKTAEGTQYVDIRGHFTGRRRARGKVSMDMTRNDGRDCLIGSFSGDVYKVWKAKRIADPRVQVEPPR